MTHDLHLGDCIEILPTLEDNSIDAIVCDPPYGLRFMGKRWDYDVPSVAMWEECLRVLKPGAHLLAFGGSRTYHRMVVNVEDAGFEIRDCLQWIFGSGFPKSHDVSKAIDKMAGAEREVIGQRDSRSDYDGKTRNSPAFNTGWRGAEGRTDIYDLSQKAITAPATAAAKQWDGWGTALKPSHELIVLARKPLTGTIAANVLEWGTGGINIDDCRVPITDGDNGGWRPNCYNKVYSYNDNGKFLINIANGHVGKKHNSGRWPANVIHDGSDEVLAGFPESVVSGAAKTGSAARFFYSAKASKSERTCGGKVDNNHPTVKPLALMQYLCRLITPPGGVVLDPFMGSGSTGIAALKEGFRFVGIERDENSYTTASERIALDAKQMTLPIA